MIIYLILFALVFILGFLSREMDSSRGDYFRFLLLCLIALFPALRYNVGQDYDAYETIFKDLAAGQQSSIYAEPGYIFLNQLVIKLGGSFFHVIFFMAIASIFFAGKAIQYFCDEKYHYLAYAVLMSSTFYLIYVFSGIRQGFCIAIFLYALKWVSERKLIPFLLCIGFGALFHATVLSMLPVFILSYFRMPFWIILIGVIGGFILASTGLPAKLFLQFTGSLTNNHYMGYANLQNAPGNSSVGTGVVLRIIAYTMVCFLGHWVKRERKYDTLYNAFALGLITYASLLKLDIMIRISDYLTAGIICLLPMTYKEISNKWDRLLFTAFILGIMLILMLANLRFSNTQLVPYQSIFDYLS